MLNVDSDLKDVIVYSREQNNNIVTFTLITLDFDSELIADRAATAGDSSPQINDEHKYLTDAPYEITFNIDGTMRTFYPSSALQSVSPPRAEGEIDRDLFEIVLEDASNYYNKILGLVSTGTLTSVHLGFLDINGNYNSDLVLPIFSGQISSWSYTVDRDDTPTTNINCTGPLTKLRQVTNRLTTEDSQAQAVSATDDCFKYSFDTNNEANVRWGPGG